MPLTDKERRELKKAGYVYHGSLGKWMKPDEIKKHNESMETVAQAEFWIAIIIVFCIFVWILSHV